MVSYALRLFSLCALLVVAASSADAQSFVLEFGRNDMVASTGAPLLTSVAPNSTLELQVYLTQIDPESRLDDPATGLAIADFTVDTGSLSTEFAPTSFTIGPGFIDDGNSGISGNTVRLALVESTRIAQTGVTTSADGTADDSVLLGSITYNVGPNAAGAFELVAAPVGGIFPFAVADSSGFPASIVVAPGSATVTAVPEASHFAALGFAVAGFCLSRRRKAARATEIQQPA